MGAATRGIPRGRRFFLRGVGLSEREAGWRGGRSRCRRGRLAAGRSTERPMTYRMAIVAACGLAGSGAAVGQTILYADVALASGLDNGSSWANAYRGVNALQRALDAAAPLTGAGTAVKVRVAKGTYAPSALMVVG